VRRFWDRNKFIDEEFWKAVKKILILRDNKSYWCAEVVKIIDHHPIKAEDFNTLSRKQLLQKRNKKYGQ
jgi:hypothetical protein